MQWFVCETGFVAKWRVSETKSWQDWKQNNSKCTYKWPLSYGFERDIRESNGIVLKYVIVKRKVSRVKSINVVVSFLPYGRVATLMC